MTEFVGFVALGIMNGAVYSMIALGFVLIAKATGIFNLAQGELVILGAYIFYAFSVQLGLPVWVSALGTCICAVGLGLLIERLFMRPLLGQPLLPLIIVTLVIGTLLQGGMMMIWGPDTLSLPRLFPTGGVEILGANISYQHLGFFVAAIVITFALILWTRRSRIGVEFMAVADSHLVSRSLGINVKTIIALAWVISFMVAAVGGILMTSITGVHYSGVGIGLRALAVVLIGGLQSLGGVLIAGPLVGVIEFLTAGYIDPLVGGGFREVAAYVVMIIVLWFRPYGFFGWKEIERV